MRTSRRRIVTWSVIVIGIAGVATAAMRPESVEVEVARVTRGPLRVTVDAQARTRVRARFVITAPVTGRLERLAVRPGDAVARGQVVARVAPLPLDAAGADAARARVADAQARLRDADGRLRQAEEASALAARVAARQRALEEAGGISRQSREEAELAALRSAEELAAAREQARAAAMELAAARSALPRTRAPAGDVFVRSPSRGRVLQLFEESERIVVAGTPLLELGDESDLEIVADVLSEDAVRVSVDAPVELVGWGGDVLLRGTVQRIEPAARTRVSALGVEEQRVNVIIRPIRPPRALGDGFRLEARIVVWQAPDVLSVPASAVFTDGTETRAFVIADRRAREVSVRVGHRSDAAVEITEGLNEGDVVGLFPSDRIRDGTRVKHSPITNAASAGGH